MSEAFWNKVKRKPPAIMFGLRLVVVPNPSVPKDHLILAIHPDNAARIGDKVNEAFSEWIEKKQD